MLAALFSKICQPGLPHLQSGEGRIQLLPRPEGAVLSTSRPYRLHRDLRAAVSAQRPNKRRCLATTCQAATVEFSKYQGLGNDFILVDNRHQQELLVSSEAAIKLCDRNFGIGGDGVIFALPPQGDVDYSMRIYNSDGSEPEMCGNGIRCLARFVAEKDKQGPRQYKVLTGAGLIQPELLPDGQVCVDMGEPILEAEQIPTTLQPTQGSTVVQASLQVAGQEWSVTCVSMGNPHAVVFGKNRAGFQVADLDLHSVGPQFEKHSVFPRKTNTHFVEMIDDGHVKVAVWERGAGPTLACGTGACAIVVAGVLEGKTSRQCKVDLPGGQLVIEWRETNNHIYMTGPAELAFRGVTEL